MWPSKQIEFETPVIDYPIFKLKHTYPILLVASSENRNPDSRGRLDHDTGKTSGANSMGEIGKNHLQGSMTS
jgi:hypothetical protein